MSTRANRIERYYDTHPVEGEEVGQSDAHFKLIVYLIAVLESFLLGQNLKVFGEMNFYQTENPKEAPKTPDVAVVQIANEVISSDEQGFPSYYIGEDGPPPRVVFEIASKDTWKIDLENKPAVYAALGVKEYFAFDPARRSVWTKEWRKRNHLAGWRRNPQTGQMEELVKDEQGRLWSEELQSFLVADENNLRLYAPDGTLRLTQAEANAQQVVLERLRAEVAERTAQMQRQRAETERSKAEKLAEILQRLGYNPDELL